MLLFRGILLWDDNGWVVSGGGRCRYEATVAIMYMIRDNLTLWAKVEEEDEDDVEDGAESNDDEGSSVCAPCECLHTTCSDDGVSLWL